MKSVIPFLLLLLVSLAGYSQNDSLQQELQDSILNLKYNERDLLISQADSAHKADSIAQEQLNREIAALQAADAATKAKLQGKLDSIKKAQEARNARIKAQVDSLRSNTVGAPVVFHRDTIFYIYAKLGPYSPNDRAAGIANKLNALVSDNDYDESLLFVYANEESHDLFHDQTIVLSITDRDASWLGEPRGQIAEQYKAKIIKSVQEYKERTGLLANLKRIGMLILVVAMFFFGIKYLNKGFTSINQWLLAKGKRYIKGVSFKNYEFLSKEREEQLVKWALKVIKWACIALVIYLALPVVFSIFPATKGVASTLFGYVLNPLKRYGLAILGYIPELITIVVIILITRYFVRFLRFLSLEVASGKLQLPGFYPDWASPTYNLLKIVIYAFAFVVIFPYLPGSDSPIFQGVSVFFGLLISLGSSSAIGNIIAGLVITYMRSFKIGDRVKIGDTTGDVIEKTMLVTRLRTIKNEDVTIPNAAILNGSTINFSSSAKNLGLVLHSTVTIGYDVPWRQVHELLISAASKIEQVKSEPKPFVLQTSLDDFYVSYQINAYTESAATAAKIYSELHANIQDAFNEAGVEILSPHYRAARDGNMVTIPASYLPEDYKVPSFNVRVDKKD